MPAVPSTARRTAPTPADRSHFFRWTPEAEVFFDLRHAAGWSDAAIADALGAERTTVCKHRQRLGLPPVCGGGRRPAVRPGWGFCRGGGTNSGHAKALAAAGWPWPLTAGGEAVDLPPRAVRVLLLLFARGPLTKREIAGGLGVRWNEKNPGAVLDDGHPRRPILAVLRDRGLTAGEPVPGRPTHRHRLTDAGVRLLKAAARDAVESDPGTATPTPDRVLAAVAAS